MHAAARPRSTTWPPRTRCRGSRTTSSTPCRMPYPGPGPPRVSGLPAARRLHRHEPQPPLHVALGFLCRPGQGRPGRRGLAPQVLRRIQRRAGHAGRVLPGHHPHRVPGIPAAAWHVEGEAASWSSPSRSKIDRAAEHRGRAGRHLRPQGQTAAAHELCTGIPKRPTASTFTVEGAGHYGIFSGRRWREKVYPQVRDFIAAHAGGVESTPGKTPKKRPTR
jgi:hypothetical protein